MAPLQATNEFVFLRDFNVLDTMTALADEMMVVIPAINFVHRVPLTKIQPANMTCPAKHIDRSINGRLIEARCSQLGDELINAQWSGGPTEGRQHSRSSLRQMSWPRDKKTPNGHISGVYSICEYFAIL